MGTHSLINPSFASQQHLLTISCVVDCSKSFHSQVAATRAVFPTLAKLASRFLHIDDYRLSATGDLYAPMCR